MTTCTSENHTNVERVQAENKNWFDNSASKAILLRRQPYHPAAQDRLPTEAKQGWACGQYLDGRPPGKN